MNLQRRLALTFALVALMTAAVVAVATPVIVGRGFAQIEAGDGGRPGGPGQGAGTMTRLHAQQVQQETVVTLIVVALVAAAVASVIGIFLAGRITGPLARLGVSAAAVARGDLRQRSGMADRSDEIGQLGRSFDSMANDLERADSSRRRFLQDAAHELKTPLAVIDATTAAVLDGVYSHDDQHLRTIRDQSRLLARIVDELRTISLADAGELPLRREPIAVDDLAAEVAEAFQAPAAQAGLTLERDLAPGIVVSADADRLRQALSALLDNALRHAPSGGRVVIEGSRSNGSVRLGVRDTGPGVASTDLGHVFERFYQADPARDRSTGSSGLGLSIVKAIVEAHGGSVGVENVASGGARFWFELPATRVSAGADGGRTGAR
jgi:two-component system sensor histidine kinase BaeS